MLFLFRSLEKSIAGKGTGTTFKAITKDFLINLEIAIPPLEEQHRIVAKIEELFSEIDKGVESLKAAKAQLQVYRQALLKHAFEGKLTAQWRADNPDKVVPAQQLLEQIKQAREDRYQQQLEAWAIAIEKWEFGGKEGKKPSKPRKVKIVSHLTKENISKLSKIPKGWQWLRFEELLISVRGGTTAPPVDYETQYPILRSSSVRSGRIDYTDIRYLKAEQLKSPSDFVKSQDLLFSRLNGTVEFVGNCALVNSKHPENLIYPDRLYCMKLVDTRWAELYELYFIEPTVRRNIEKKAKSTAGHKRISIPDITEIPVPLMGVDEAIQIVKMLDEKITVIVQNEQQIDYNIRRAEMLRQSILKQAFSGQLVPQDPTDEPASQLLARIQAEKAEREKKEKASKKTHQPRKTKTTS